MHYRVYILIELSVKVWCSIDNFLPIQTSTVWLILAVLLMAGCALVGISWSILWVVQWGGHFLPCYVIGNFPFASVLGVGYSRYSPSGRDLARHRPPTGATQRWSWFMVPWNWLSRVLNKRLLRMLSQLKWGSVTGDLWIKFSLIYIPPSRMYTVNIPFHILLILHPSAVTSSVAKPIDTI